MNLHRTTLKAEWEAIDPQDYNYWQQIAAQTNEIIAPGNFITITGLTLVTSGLRDINNNQTLKGVLKIGLGRMCDVIDGTVADKTGTKSPTGEVLDVTVDKAEAILALPMCLKAGILPKTSSGIFFVQHASNIALATFAKKRNTSLHPSKEGKLSTASQWSSLILYGLAHVVNNNDMPKIAKGIEVTAHAMTAVTAYLASQAIIGYAKDVFIEQKILSTSE